MNFILDTAMERDIDLLILEEFAVSPQFAKIFLSAANISASYTIKSIIHSKTDANLGESDIVIVLDIEGARHALHIEDKIDALAMPRQHDRYELRAQKDISTGEYDSYSVIIVAPEKYLSVNQEAKKYAHQVKYEQMRDYFASQKDARSLYKLALIDRAIIDQKNGYQYEANPSMVQFCKAMADYQKEKYPGLPQGSVAWWPGYDTMLEGVQIVFKADKGFCDLQFSHCKKQELFARVKNHLSDRMLVEQTGKSASVRIVVTPVEFGKRFGDHIQAVDEALEALQELYNLSKELI